VITWYTSKGEYRLTGFGALGKADAGALFVLIPTNREKTSFDAFVVRGEESEGHVLAELKVELTRGVGEFGTESAAGYAASDEGETESDSYVPSEGDQRERVMRQIRLRRGQRAFRQALRKRYGDRCMVTGETVIDVIEAAHITPYRGKSEHAASNGLLLRSDLHALFDLDLLGIEPGSLTIRVNESLKKTPYAAFDGCQLLTAKGKNPNKKALDARWEQFIHRKQRLPAS
jgi:hypothetical protein